MSEQGSDDLYVVPSPALSLIQVDKDVEEVAYLRTQTTENLGSALDHRLVGIMVQVSASRTEDSGFESSLRRDFSGSSHIGGEKIGTPVATLPGAWRCKVCAGTGWIDLRIP